MQKKTQHEGMPLAPNQYSWQAKMAVSLQLTEMTFGSNAP